MMIPAIIKNLLTIIEVVVVFLVALAIFVAINYLLLQFILLLINAFPDLFYNHHFVWP